jgi:hypothetical protein
MCWNDLDVRSDVQSNLDQVGQPSRLPGPAVGAGSVPDGRRRCAESPTLRRGTIVALETFWAG